MCIHTVHYILHTSCPQTCMYIHARMPVHTHVLALFLPLSRTRSLPRAPYGSEGASILLAHQSYLDNFKRCADQPGGDTRCRCNGSEYLLLFVPPQVHGSRGENTGATPTARTIRLVQYGPRIHIGALQRPRERERLCNSVIEVPVCKLTTPISI